jgi:hypothetical protein
MRKQIDRVYEALQEGCYTSREISFVTGLPTAHCSAYLNDLRAMGLARIVKRDSVFFEETKKRSHEWRLAKLQRVKKDPVRV